MQRPTTAARRAAALVAALVAALALLPRAIAAQGDGAQVVDKQTYERGRQMLEQIRKDLREFYYDSTYRGLDLDERFRSADSAMRVAKNANHMFGAIAQYLFNFDDSHTNFYPPDRVADVDYGFAMQFIGDTCFVVSVRPKSDAEKKGLKVGDAVLQVDAFKLERHTFWTLRYIYDALSPRPGMRLRVRSPDGTEREIEALAKITMGERIVDLTNQMTISRLIQEYEDASRRPFHLLRSVAGDSVLVWRMPQFLYGDTENIDRIMKRVQKHRALVLDLRNNPGGAVSTMMYLIGGFFDRDIPVATARERKTTETWVAKRRYKEPFRGMFVILVNSGSASASEITARTMQLEGRAIVVGDRTMGAVVTSRIFPHEVGFGRRVPYAVSVTVADVIMPDGQRLEKVGVTPDEIVLPTGADLAARRDPALARALAIAGVTRTPEQARALLRSEEKSEEQP